MFVLVLNSRCTYIYNNAVSSESSGSRGLWHVISRYQCIFICGHYYVSRLDSSGVKNWL